MPEHLFELHVLTISYQVLLLVIFVFQSALFFRKLGKVRFSFSWELLEADCTFERGILFPAGYCLLVIFSSVQMAHRQTKVSNKAFEELPSSDVQSRHPLCIHCELWAVLSFHALLNRLTFLF